MAKSKSLRLSTRFEGLSPGFERYQTFLRNVVMDHSPSRIEEHGEKPGMIQTIKYYLSKPVAALLSSETNMKPGLAECIEIVFRGGARIRDWTTVSFEIIFHARGTSLPFPSESLPYPSLIKAFDAKGEHMEWKVDDSRFADLRDALQHGFSHAEAKEIMLHFRNRILWMRALLAPCEDARLSLLSYIQEAFHAELHQTPPPHDPKEWDAYCHLCLCKKRECKIFTKQWETAMLQTRVQPWTKLYERHGRLFRDWGVAPH